MLHYTPSFHKTALQSTFELGSVLDAIIANLRYDQKDHGEIWCQPWWQTANKQSQDRQKDTA